MKLHLKMRNEEMEEIWKEIEDYGEGYEVSNFGRVRNRKHKVLKPYSSNGYQVVSLSYKGKCKKVKVHRLVAIAFLPNPDNKKEIDHINTIRDDNKVENLRWVTTSENAHNTLTIEKNRVAHLKENLSEDTLKKMSLSARGRIFDKEVVKRRNVLITIKNKERSKPVMQYDKNKNFIARYESITDAATKTNISITHISQCANEKDGRKTAGGFIWKYI